MDPPQKRFKASLYRTLVSCQWTAGTAVRFNDKTVFQAIAISEAKTNSRAEEYRFHRTSNLGNFTKKNRLIINLGICKTT